MNIDILKLERKHTILYLNMLQSNTIHSNVDKPTTFNTLLDHMPANDATSQITPGILKSDNRD